MRAARYAEMNSMISTISYSENSLAMAITNAMAILNEVIPGINATTSHLKENALNAVMGTYGAADATA